MPSLWAQSTCFTVASQSDRNLSMLKTCGNLSATVCYTTARDVSVHSSTHGMLARTSKAMLAIDTSTTLATHRYLHGHLAHNVVRRKNRFEVKPSRLHLQPVVHNILCSDIFEREMSTESNFGSRVSSGDGVHFVIFSIHAPLHWRRCIFAAQCHGIFSSRGTLPCNKFTRILDKAQRSRTLAWSKELKGASECQLTISNVSINLGRYDGCRTADLLTSASPEALPNVTV